MSITSGPESDAVADVRPIGLVETTPTEFELDPWTRVVRRHGTPVQLTKVEYDLLEFLVDNPQQVFTRRQLLGQIWRDDRSGRRTVDVHVSRLRAKLGADIVTTTRGVGYRLTDGAPITVVHHRPNGDVHEYEERKRLHISEDWAATVVGLLLIALILTGVITKGVLQ
ncbi:winged helix-turn-helix domain-containing protein [Luedemannella flava]